MKPTFIILMLLSCCTAVGSFMMFVSALHCRRYKDNGDCPNCDAIAMHPYYEKCGLLVKENVHTCTQCGNAAYNNFCGYCGAEQGGK